LLKHKEVIIIGAGISGSALFYELAKFSNIKSVLIVEKYDDVAPLNSSASGNSQTIHSGDIETNYSLEKAKEVKKTASLLKQYTKRHDYLDKCIFKYPKMLLGVGEEQVEYIKKRQNDFSDIFPNMEYWDKNRLSQIEPMLCKDRKETISAMGSLDDYCAINYGKIAKSFIENAIKEDNNFECEFNCEVKSITKEKDIYKIKTTKGEWTTNFVMVNSGAHALVFAHRMGYGKDYSAIPMGGNYYYLNEPLVKSKIYTVQNPKLPFAAIHADPDIGLKSHDVIRLGPTALPLLSLERYKDGNKFHEFLELLDFDTRVLRVLFDSLKDKDIREFILRNIFYDIPYFGKKLFLSYSKSIIPSLKMNDIRFAKEVGGLRAQIIDKKNKKLLLGEVSINEDDGIIFNMTPSPGATSCLGNGIKDVKYICGYLHKEFYEDKFNELLNKESE
jgi:malate dehydrogenase (quinone)